LCYYQNDTQAISNTNPKGIDLFDVQVVKFDDRIPTTGWFSNWFQFQIITQERTWTLATKLGKHEKDEWMKAIAFVASGWMKSRELMKLLQDQEYENFYQIDILRKDLSKKIFKDVNNQQQPEFVEVPIDHQTIQKIISNENPNNNNEQPLNVQQQTIVNIEPIKIEPKVDDYMSLRIQKSFNQQNMQTMTFSTWISFHLKHLKVDLEDLSDELSDGLIFCSLAEVLTGDSISNKNTNPIGGKDKFDNVNQAITLISNYFNAPYPEISIPQLISGNLKSILDLCWWIIYNASIMKIEFAGLKGRFALLNWIKDLVSLYKSVDVVDFTNSFSDGLALCALIHSFDPDLINFHNLNSMRRNDNIRQALTICSKNFQIPIYFDTSDFDELDESSMIIYLSFLYERVNKK